MMIIRCALCGKPVNPRSTAILNWGVCPWMADTLLICPRHLAKETQSEKVKRQRWRMVYVRLARRCLLEIAL